MRYRLMPIALTCSGFAASMTGTVGLGAQGRRAIPVINPSSAAELRALVRYARGVVDLNAPGSRAVSTDGGGLQAAAGLKVLF